MTRLRRGLALAATLLLAVACRGEGERESSRVHVVEMRGFEFVPAVVQVSAGDTVIWVNRDGVPHTATVAGGWDSGSIAAGDSWRRVADDNGNISYYCVFHPTMRGQLAFE